MSTLLASMSADTSGASANGVTQRARRHDGVAIGALGREFDARDLAGGRDACAAPAIVAIAFEVDLGLERVRGARADGHVAGQRAFGGDQAQVTHLVFARATQVAEHDAADDSAVSSDAPLESFDADIAHLHFERQREIRKRCAARAVRVGAWGLEVQHERLAPRPSTLNRHETRSVGLHVIASCSAATSTSSPLHAIRSARTVDSSDPRAPSIVRCPSAAAMARCTT